MILSTMHRWQIPSLKMHSTSPSTTIATLATLVSSCRQKKKQIGSHKHVTRCLVDWKRADSIVEPLHARFHFILRDMLMMKVSTRTVTHLTVRRVMQLWKET
jgi:hypothetical protein